jgi:hypothetical protein
MLGTTIPKFQGYIGLIDGTLIKTRKPWNNPKHKIWCIWVQEDLLNEQHYGGSSLRSIPSPRF